MHRNLNCFLFSGEAAVRGRVWFSRSVRIIKKQEEYRRRKRGGRRMCRTVETGGGCHCLLPQRCKRLAKLLNALFLFFLQNLGFFLQMQMLSISQQSFSDGSHWFDLRRDGFAGGQRFRFTPKVEDYSRRTQVKF